jgi:phosphoglycolate phosphatase/pyrophosphatase PpaX
MVFFLYLGLEHFFAAYTDEHLRLHNPPEVTHMLDQLRNAGFQLGIVTGKGSRSAEISLREWKLDEGILLAMQKLGADPRETIYVGDSDADVIAGRAAGLQTVGVNWLTVTQKGGRLWRSLSCTYTS